MKISDEFALVKKKYVECKTNDNIWRYVNKLDNYKEIKLKLENNEYLFSFPMQDSNFNNLVVFKEEEKNKLNLYISHIIESYL
jgi:hypothetical protein